MTKTDVYRQIMSHYMANKAKKEKRKLRRKKRLRKKKHYRQHKSKKKRSYIWRKCLTILCYRASRLSGERVERLGGLQQDLRHRGDGEDEGCDPGAGARGQTLPAHQGLQVVRQRPQLQTR